MKKKLLKKDDMIRAGVTHNHYLIMEEYLKVMPFTAKERQEVKTSLLVKIEYAFQKNDKKVTKKLDKRMNELIKEIDKRNKDMVKNEEFNEEEFIKQIKNEMIKRDTINEL